MDSTLLAGERRTCKAQGRTMRKPREKEQCDAVRRDEKQPSGFPGLGWVKEHGRADSGFCLRARVLRIRPSYCRPGRRGGGRVGESEAYKHDSDVISQFWVLK